MNTIRCAIIDDNEQPRKANLEVLRQVSDRLSIPIEAHLFENAEHFENALNAKPRQPFLMTISDVHMPTEGTGHLPTVEEGGKKVLELIMERQDDPLWLGAQLVWHTQYSEYLALTGHVEELVANLELDFPWFHHNLSRFKKRYTAHDLARNLEHAFGWLLEYLKAADSESIVRRSIKIMELDARLMQAANSQSTVLLTGETGCGKEVFAERIHYLSPRRDEKFSAVDCGSLSPELLASELFGHLKGSFTSAFADKAGIFKTTNQGTIFLDEVGEMVPDTQVRFLRVLQKKEFTPVGSTDAIRADVRIIAATNRDLKIAIAEKVFREDLYYRLAVIEIKIPPLRDCPEDIIPLAQFFIRKYNLQNGKTISTELSADLTTALLSYRFPGNVRELEHMIESAVVTSTETELSLEHFLGKFEGVDVVSKILNEEMVAKDSKAVFREYVEALKSWRGDESWRLHIAKVRGTTKEAVSGFIQDRPLTAKYLAEVAQTVLEGLPLGHARHVQSMQKYKRESALSRLRRLTRS